MLDIYCYAFSDRTILMHLNAGLTSQNRMMQQKPQNYCLLRFIVIDSKSKYNGIYGTGLAFHHMKNTVGLWVKIAMPTENE